MVLKTASLPTNEELLAVLKLVSEEGIAVATSLYPSVDYGIPCPRHGDESAMAEFRCKRLTEHWKAVQKLPAYQWLNSRQEYRKAWSIYAGKKKAKTTCVRFGSAEADFQFLHPIVWGLMIYLRESHPSMRRRLPDKRTAVAVLGYATQLLEADLGYLKLRPDTRAGLEALRRDLEAVALVRKTYENSTYAERRFVTALVWHYLSDFGETLYTAVRELCGLVDYEVSGPVLEAQIQDIKVRHRLTYPGKSAKSR